MSDSILVMGAGGRFGHAAAEAFRDAGWRVKSLVRPGRAAFAARGTEVVEIVTRDAAVEAAQGCAIVLNALNPAITMWQRDALSHAYAGDRGGGRQRRDADVSRQRVELRPRPCRR